MKEIRKSIIALERRPWDEYKSECRYYYFLVWLSLVYYRKQHSTLAENGKIHTLFSTVRISIVRKTNTIKPVWSYLRQLVTDVGRPRITGNATENQLI